MTFRLRYRPGTDLARRYPLPTVTTWDTADAAEATRLRCVNAESIEVVEG